MAATTAEYEKGLTFEKVWAALMEDRQQMVEDRRERKEAEAKMDRRMEETDRQIKETDRSIGKLGKRFGDMAEYLVAPNMVARFKELGLVFDRTYQNEIIRDKTGGKIAEADITLRNGECVMIVETKMTPDEGDVKDHLKRMEKLRARADLERDTRTYYGAVAGVVMSEGVKDYVLKQGFYAIQPSGETFTITAPQGPGAPRAW